MKCPRKWWPRILILLASVWVAGPIIRGLVESLADALAAMLKLWAGQRAGVKPLQRKPMVMLVYGLATLSRPLIALAGSWATVSALRSTDRLGKGIRGAPLDAILADATSSILLPIFRWLVVPKID